MNNIINQGSFIIILFLSELEKYYKTNTFLYLIYLKILMKMIIM